MYDTDNNFRSHNSTEDGFKNMGAVRSACHTLAITLGKVCPEGRELALARTKLEEVMFWANAGIARKMAK